SWRRKRSARRRGGAQQMSPVGAGHTGVCAHASRHRVSASRLQGSRSALALSRLLGQNDTVAEVPALPKESLLVFSDVHLGSDLNDRTKSPRRSPGIDQDLVRFLAHYSAEKPNADRWRIVIAGDLIDFIGMSIDPDASDSL